MRHMNSSHLHEIPLPTFDGDPLKWESFRDLFSAMVIDVPGLSDCRKLLILQSKLTGDAAKLIKFTQQTSSHFSDAWEDLWYGNLRIISATHMRNLFTILSAQKSDPIKIKRLINSFW